MRYLKQLEEAENALQLEKYETCIQLCGKIVENGLKDLYKLQVKWSKEMDIEFTLLEDYQASLGNQGQYSVENSTLFNVLKFYRISGMWNEVKKRVKSNLHFTEKIPWHELRFLRNDAVHIYTDFTREQAIEFIHHLKVFMYECELSEDPEKVKPHFLVNRTTCKQCDENLIESWNYCPNCGTQNQYDCWNCKKPLETNWLRCPFCEAQQSEDPSAMEALKLYRAYCEAIWADHVVNSDERELLRRKRIELGISEDTADSIEQKVVDPAILSFIDLIEAVLIDGVIDQYEHEFLMKKAQELRLEEKIAVKLISNMKPQETEVVDNWSNLFGLLTVKRSKFLN